MESATWARRHSSGSIACGTRVKPGGRCCRLGATGYGNSPYQPLSSFAGNWLLISPDALMDDGLLTARDCGERSFPADLVDFDAVATFKRDLIGVAWNNLRSGARSDVLDAYEKFRIEQARWLDDYALFCALKTRYNGAYYVEWPSDLVNREPSVMARAQQELKHEIELIAFAQFLFFRQAMRLKHYARSRGLQIIGDLPFFVSPDSSDVWANPRILRPRRQPSCAVCGGRAAGLFRGAGAALGQSGLQLGSA